MGASSKAPELVEVVVIPNAVESELELVSSKNVGVVDVLPNTCISNCLISPNSGTVTIGARSGGAKSGDAKSGGAKSGGAKIGLKITQPRRLERVLAADDSKLSREILQRLMIQLGFDCLMVSSGEEAIVEIGKNVAGFGMIFLDMNMTGISGVETTVALRRLGCTAPIIGLTGDDSPECREKFLRGAAQQVLTKPLRLQVLKDVFQAFLPLPSPPLASPSSLALSPSLLVVPRNRVEFVLTPTLGPTSSGKNNITCSSTTTIDVFTSINVSATMINAVTSSPAAISGSSITGCDIVKIVNRSGATCNLATDATNGVNPGGVRCDTSLDPSDTNGTAYPSPCHDGLVLPTFVAQL